MWYSGGGQNEPDAIGYATSRDGLHWRKHKDNPIFRPDKRLEWEQDRVNWFARSSAGWLVRHVLHRFRDINTRRSASARSRDGIYDWERHPAEPHCSCRQDPVDHDSCYKPYAISMERSGCCGTTGVMGTGTNRSRAARGERPGLSQTTKRADRDLAAPILPVERGARNFANILNPKASNITSMTSTETT